MLCQMYESYYNNVLRLPTYRDRCVHCAACEGNLRHDMGLIISPNYPDKYPNNLVCEWTIVLATGENILLNFIDFDMNRDPSNDFLEIR